MTATLFPVSFHSFGHFSGRIAKPSGFSILQVTENPFSLALIAEMDIGDLGAHGAKQNYFVTLFRKILVSGEMWTATRTVCKIVVHFVPAKRAKGYS